MADSPTSRLAKAADICGWSNSDLALIVGLSEHTVRAYRTGRRTEYLTGQQRMAIIRCVQLWIDQAEAELAELKSM